MSLKGKNCLICNCEKSMTLDAKRLTKALDCEVENVYEHLCRSQLSVFEQALSDGKPLVVGCTQEAPLFYEVAEESGRENTVSFANIREYAGWSKQGGDAAAKMAALLVASQFEAKPTRLKSIESDGMCLVYGAGQKALEAAELLSQKLSVTLLLSADEEPTLPRVSTVPVYRGDIQSAKGAFGDFSVTVNNYAPVMPSSRDSLQFLMARDGAESQCSVILDMSGKTPLLTGHTHRDGYKKVDPGDPALVMQAVFELSEMVGEFEKPIYVDYNSSTCAHARSQKPGCSKCLDVCPAGAISDCGDIVEIDSNICGGCGSCHAVCPTGSISYQYPNRSDVIERSQKMLQAYEAAGGKSAALLIHDERFGDDLISAIARYGQGLPANTIPVSTHSVTMMGHVEMAALLASGAQKLSFLCNPKHEEELTALKTEIELCNSLLSGLELGDNTRISLICETDPDRVENELWDQPKQSVLTSNSFTPVGTKRDIARLAIGHLQAQSTNKPDVIELPQNAPYGTVEIDQSRCTLCMACTSACPSNAIIDTPGEPTLRFVENACVQCGLCAGTCPENALELIPRYNFSPAAMQPATLYQEEPFCCVVCDTPFATKSTIERISSQLAGKHTMFADSERANLIQMCEDCRIEAQANSQNDPFSAADRPRVRTTEDYIEADKGNLSAKDFLMDE